MRFDKFTDGFEKIAKIGIPIKHKLPPLSRMALGALLVGAAGKAGVELVDAASKKIRKNRPESVGYNETTV